MLAIENILSRGALKDWAPGIETMMPGVTMRVQPVYTVPRIINMHVINDHIFRVYSHVIYKDDLIVFKYPARVLASTLCGDSIAVVLESGDLKVPETGASHSFSMFLHEPRKVKIAASPDGKFISVNSSADNLTILQHEQGRLTLHNSVDLKYHVHFQITSHDNAPFLWTLNEKSGSVALELYSMDDSEPFQFGRTAVAKCPLVNMGSNKPKLQIHACESHKKVGVVCAVNDEAFLLGYRQMIVGDVTSGVVKCHYPVQLLTTSVRGEGNNVERLVYASRPDHLVTIINLDAFHFDDQPVAILTGMAAEFNYNDWTQYAAAVGTHTEEEEEEKKKEKKEEGMKSQLLPILLTENEHYEANRIIIDSRKRPWRFLALDDQGIRVVCAAKKIGDQADSGIKYYHTMSYLRALQVLVVTSTTGENHYLKSPDMPELPVLRSNEPLISWGLVGKHSLILIYPMEVEIYSSMYPFPKISSIKMENVILSASIGENNCAIQTYDAALVVDVMHSQNNSALLRLDTGGAPVQFVSCKDDRTYVGLDLALAHHRDFFDSKQFPDMKRFLNNNELMRGCIAVFNRDNTLIDVQQHPKAPSGYHKFPDGNEFALYGLHGMAAWVKAAQSFDNPEFLLARKSGRSLLREMIDFKIPLRWGDVSPEKDCVLLYGSELYVAARGTCSRLAVSETFGSKKHYVSSAFFIGEDTVAYIEKQELKYIQDANLQCGTSPFVMNSKKLELPKNMDVLPIESQRVLIFNDVSSVKFLDSFTLKPLTIKAAPRNLNALTVWRFKEKGKLYEHLVAFDGNRTLESYTIERKGHELEFNVKFRYSLPESSAGPGEPAIGPHYRNLINPLIDMICLCVGRSLKAIKPTSKTVFDEVRLPAPAIYISNARGYLIVTTEQNILVFKCHEMKIRCICTIPVGPGTRGKRRNFTKHVAQVVRDPNEHIYILASSQETKSKQSVLLGFIVSERTQNSMNYTVSPMNFPSNIRIKYPMLGVRDLLPDPDAPACSTFMRAYTLMLDHSVCTIDIFPPEYQGVRPIAVF